MTRKVSNYEKPIIDSIMQYLDQRRELGFFWKKGMQMICGAAANGGAVLIQVDPTGSGRTKIVRPEQKLFVDRFKQFGIVLDVVSLGGFIEQSKIMTIPDAKGLLDKMNKIEEIAEKLARGI